MTIEQTRNNETRQYVGRVFGVRQAAARDIDGTLGWEVSIFVAMPVEEIPLRQDDIYFEIRRGVVG